jgi:hypothetical protein
MIALAQNCLVFKFSSGESLPLSPEMVTVELMGETAKSFDAEFLRHAANAVFHYFKNDLGVNTISVGEFAGALEKVLQGFALKAAEIGEAKSRQVANSDLGRLARESGDGCELFFFPRLRDELRLQMQQGPRVVRFHHLRDCVKKLVGVNRWSVRCQTLEEQIVNFLRECVWAEDRKSELALVVE